MMNVKEDIIQDIKYKGDISMMTTNNNNNPATKKMELKYFTYDEFNSPDIQSGGDLMDMELLLMVDRVREQYGKPIIITSGYRTPQHNARVGGKTTSSHIKGLAIDIACDNSTDRFKLKGLLQEVGFNRIGIDKKFIHVDVDKDKIQNILWIY
jgi:zinc D-Ala-D-Ala carboxypeptidase